jgi:hypothetical protein
MIIGAPKSLDDIPPFTVNTITELIKGMNQQLAAGTPVDVPTMMPIGQLAQVAKTLSEYHAIVAGLAAGPPDGCEDVAAWLDELTGLGKELLATPEPPPPPRIHTSRLILP